MPKMQIDKYSSRGLVGCVFGKVSFRTMGFSLFTHAVKTFFLSHYAGPRDAQIEILTDRKEG